MVDQWIPLDPGPRWCICGQITRWVDDEPQPGIVEFKFSDIFGASWTFIGKFVYFTDENLWGESVYPKPGTLVCEIISRSVSDTGLEIAEIETDRAFRGLISEEGPSRFQISVGQLVEGKLWGALMVPLIKK